MDRGPEEYRGLGVRDGALDESVEAQTLETPGFLAFPGIGLPVGRAAPATAGELVEQEPEQRVAEDAEFLASVGEGLDPLHEAVADASETMFKVELRLRTAGGGCLSKSGSVRPNRRR